VPRFVIFDYVEATPKRDDHAVGRRLVSNCELSGEIPRAGSRWNFIARSRAARIAADGLRRDPAGGANETSASA